MMMEKKNNNKEIILLVSFHVSHPHTFTVNANSFTLD